MSDLPEGFEVDPSTTFEDRFSAASGKAKGLPTGFELDTEAKPITGPTGENPAYHQATQDTQIGNFIPGDIFAGRGLPGGTPLQKGAALATSALPAVAAGVGSALGAPAAIDATTAALTKAGVAPDIIDLLAGAEPKAASKIPHLVKAIAGASGVVAAEKAGEALGISKDTVHDIGLPLLFKLFGH